MQIQIPRKKTKNKKNKNKTKNKTKKKFFFNEFQCIICNLCLFKSLINKIKNQLSSLRKDAFICDMKLLIFCKQNLSCATHCLHCIISTSFYHTPTSVSDRRAFKNKNFLIRKVLKINILPRP